MHTTIFDMRLVIDIHDRLDDIPSLGPRLCVRARPYVLSSQKKSHLTVKSILRGLNFMSCRNATLGAMRTEPLALVLGTYWPVEEF